MKGSLIVLALYQHNRENFNWYNKTNFQSLFYEDETVVYG